MDNNEENNEELVVNPVVDDNANSNIDEELEEIKFQNQMMKRCVLMKRF